MKAIEQTRGAVGPLLGGIFRIKAPAAREIALADLDEGDLLLLQTANSVYSFSLTDVAAKGGTLMGGRLGEASATAWLVGTKAKADGDDIEERPLAPGRHAVFMVATEDEPRRLITSAIKRITHIKAPHSRS
jgi:hypothetical protein